MPLRLLLAAALLAVLLLTAVVLAIRARSYTATSLRDVVLSSPGDDCAMPCFLGIRPGVTTAPEAIAALSAHPWVEHVEISTTNSLEILWSWNGTQPAIFDAGGTLTRDANDVISLITVPTTIAYASAWFELGAPEPGTRLAQNREAVQTIEAGEGAYRIFLITCPAHQIDFWRSPVVIYFGRTSIGLSDSREQTVPGREHCA